MNSGQLDTRILITQPTVEPNDIGDAVEVFSVLGKRWAEVRFLKGRELVDALQKVSEVDTKFVIRYDSIFSQLNTKSRITIVKNNEVYDVLEALPIPGGRPEKIEILAKRRSDQ